MTPEYSARLALARSRAIERALTEFLAAIVAVSAAIIYLTY